LFDGLDLIIFKTVQKAELFFEPIDVKEGKCLAYDSKGRLLHFGARKQEDLWLRILCPVERTVLLSVEENPTHVVGFRNALVDVIRHAGTNESWLSRATLPELVTKALEIRGQ
jgi:hypothetical protein